MQAGSNHTIRLLRWLTVLALLTPALFFAAAAWKDRSTILTDAESDGAKIVALLREQAGNLFAGHQAHPRHASSPASPASTGTRSSRAPTC